MKDLKNKIRVEGWKVQSSDEEGFHKVITPDTCECREAQVFRLNLKAKETYTLESGELEMHPVLLEGKARLSHRVLNQEMEKVRIMKESGSLISENLTSLFRLVISIRFTGKV